MLWWIFGGLVTGAWLPWLWAAGLLLAVWILLGLQAWYGDCWRPNIGRALLLLLAVCWAALAVQQEQSRQLPETEAGTIWLISGRVQGLPIVRERSFFGGEPVITAYFVLDELSLPEDFPVPLRALAVNWSQADPAQLAPGHRITAQLELRTPRGRVNSEGFDSERNAFARGIHARARLQELLAVEPGSDWLQQYRLQLTQRMQQALLPFENARALIPATVNGDWRDTTPSQWRLLQETGTAHLISISGFHITLVAGMVWWFSRWLLAGLLCRSSGLLSAQRLAIIPAWLAALGYTALAGLPVPALRALFMASVAMLMLASLHRSAPLRSLLLTAVLLLLPNPLAALDTSFWLSYGAVAWLGLIHANGIRHPISFAASMTLIFGVWVAWGFGQWNLSALPANLLLIPLYSFCIVPLGAERYSCATSLPGWLPVLVTVVFRVTREPSRANPAESIRKSV